MSMPFNKKKNTNGEIFIICLYVNDLLFTPNSEKMFDQSKQDILKNLK